MDEWWQVIIEWVNCLDILNVNVESKCDFCDGYVYNKIIELIGVWKADNSTSEDYDHVSAFIKEEYPEFLTNDNTLEGDNEIRIASLFLLRASQEPEFQKPMSTKLQHETQIKIKMFLETVLPYGRHVTTDIIDMAINELTDDNHTSPQKTSKKRILREFFTSPAAVSAQKQRIVNERDRQIRLLKSELETERFEKAYLQDDLKNREEKIRNLQGKLQLKNEELKSMRNERINAYTPQSCKKTNNSMEIVYKKEIESLENYITKLQKESEKMELEKESLMQNISMLKIKLETCEDKSAHFQKQSEMLLAQMELKDREIVDLRIQNEELRNLIKETKGLSAEEQSFECDETSFNKGRASLNLSHNEALSSVIEVQLLEVKDECEKLRVQLQTMTKNLNNANTEIRGLKFTNDMLKEKVEDLNQMTDRLSSAEDNLKVKTGEVSRLENELMVLSEEYNHAKNQILSKDRTLQEAEANEKALKNELNKLTARLQILEESMQTENERVASLKAALSAMEQDKVILSKRLKITEENLTGKENALRILEESDKNLKNDLNKLDAKTVILEESLRIEEAKSEELMNSLSLVKKDNLVLLEKLKISEKQLASLRESLKKAEAHVSNLTEEVKNSCELLEIEKCTKTELSSTVLKLENEKTFLTDELKSATSLIENQVQELKDKTIKIESLETKLNKLNSDMKSLELFLQEEKSLTSAVKSEISLLKIEKEDMLTRLQETESKLNHEATLVKQANEIISQLQYKINEIQTNLDATQDIVNVEKQLSSDLKLKTANLEKEKASVLADLEAAEAKVAGLNSLLKQAMENIEQRNKDNSNLENSLKQMQEFLAGERSEKAYLQTIIEKLENREQSLSENLNIVKAELKEKLQSLLLAMEEMNKMKTQISNLESSNQSLEENLNAEKIAVNELNSCLSQTEKELKKTIADNVKMKENINAYEKSINEFRNDNEIAKTELNSLNEELKCVMIKSKEQLNLIKVLDSENKEKCRKIIEYESVIGNYKTSTDDLQKQITTLTEEITLTAQNLVAKNKIVNDLNVTVNNLEHALQEKNKTINELDKNVADFKSAIDFFVECFKKISKGSLLAISKFNFSTTYDLKEFCKEFESSVDSLQLFIENKDDLIEKRNMQIEQNACVLKQLNENISELEKNIKASNTEIVNLSSKLEYKDNLLLQCHERELKLQEELNSLQAKMSDERKTFEVQLLQMTEDTSFKLATLQNEKLALEKELQNELSCIKLQIDHLQNEKMLLKGQVSQYSLEISNLRVSINDLQSEKSQLQQQLCQCSKELCDSQSLNKTLQNQIKHLETTKNEQESQILAVQTELNQKKHELNVLENTKQILEEQKDTQMSEVLTKMKVLKNENATLMLNLTNLTEECTTLNSQINQYSEKCKSLDHQNNILKSQIVDLTFNLESKDDAIKKKTEEEIKVKNLSTNLEHRLTELQQNHEQLMINLKLKENSLEILQQKVESLGKEKMESELKLKEVITNLQEVKIHQDTVLETQDKALKEKDTCVEELQKSCNKLELCLKEEKEKNTLLEKNYFDLENHLKLEKNSANEIEKHLSQCRNELKVSQNKYNEMRVLNDNLQSSYLQLYSAISDLSTNMSISIEEKATDSIFDKIKMAIEMLTTFKKNFKQFSIERESLINKLSEKEGILEEKHVENNKLREEVEQFKENKNKYEKLVSETLKKTELFQMLLSLAMKLRHEFDLQLKTIQENWSVIGTKYGSVLTISHQTCDNLKKLVHQKEELDRQIVDLRQSHFENAHYLLEGMHKSIVWTEKNLKNGILTSDESNFESLHNVSLNESFSSDETTVNSDIERNKRALQNMQSVKEKIDVFVSSVESYTKSLKNGSIKLELIEEERLKVEVDKLSKEKKDLKDKLENMRTRNAKLEKNIDGLRSEIKSLIEGQSEKIDSSMLLELNEKIVDLEKQKEELEKEKENLLKERSAWETEKVELEKQKEELEKEKENLLKERSTWETERVELEKQKDAMEREKEIFVAKYKEDLTQKDVEFETHMKEMHGQYETKLNVLKQKLKTTYNEQISKLKQEQEKAVEDRVKSFKTKMEQQCRKHTEEINRYKNHISELSTQYWDVGEKLIVEKQEKEQTLHQLQSLKEKLNENKSDHLTFMQKTMSLDRRNYAHDHNTFKSKSEQSFKIIREETTSRRESIRSIQAIGFPLNAEDEEGEIFDSNYLEDLKAGRQCLPAPDLDRLSVLQRRNTLCKPHLKSSYPAETQFHNTKLSEEEIKTGGGSEEIFNDSLSQSLLPGQKPRKKDRTQPSYKRPGPPTPSKNGGRLSLQGNELQRSPTSKVLKERNTDRRITVTPRRLKDLFSTSKKQDENGSPRNRLSIFRRQRPATEKN